MIGTIGTAVALLVGILESMVELLDYFTNEDNEIEDEELEDNIADLVIAIYETVDEFTEEDIPLDKEAIRSFVDKTMGVIENIMKVVKLFK